ncbi:advillin-like isoform X2 [Mizuhopecten yessoensis]|uniref:advillin-like isoform X2 n=1 Tax=Mizuhopecten yessoensis TaxID=6573 RepID=UPI000B45BA1F|nr:advillin-like isoform X2 [Mizuhopecten yessoensis]
MSVSSLASGDRTSDMAGRETHIGACSATRPRSGKKKACDRPASRTTVRAPILPGSPAHTDRPYSRTTGRSSPIRLYPKSPTLISERVYSAYARSRPSTGKTIQSKSHTMTSATKSGRETSASFRPIDNAFIEVTKDVIGLSVWRIENKLKVVKIDEQEHGFFHEGAAYVVLKVDAEEVTSLHYWCGLACPESEAKLIEQKAHELDRILNYATLFSKETQSLESTRFLRLFPEGVIYIESKPKTTVSRAAAYIKSMYKVMGRKYIRAVCVEPSLDALDTSSACILDGHPRMYVWVGSHCPYSTRIRAINLAKKFRNMQRKGIAHIIVIDEKDENMNTAFLKKLPNGHTSLTNGHTSMTNVNHLEPGSVSGEGTENTVLHRVSGEKVMYDMPEASRCPLYHKYLVRRDSYLLDRGPNAPLYVWVGHQASEGGISNALLRGKAFCEHRGYPSTMTVCRLMEDHEPTEFKKNFYDWRETDTKRRQLTKKYSIGNIERALFSTKDNRTVAKMNEHWSDDVFPDGDPDTEVWRVQGDTLEQVPWDQHGVFTNGQCYIIRHRITEDDGNVHTVIYYWMGSKSPESVQQKTIDLVLDMNKAIGYKCVLVRVLDEKEPPHFMSTIQNSIIVYDEDLQDKPSDRQMYCIRELDNGSMRVQQVPASSEWLNTSASFVLTTPSACFLWYGKKSGGHEREYAKNLLGFLNPSRMYTFDIVTEGKEGNAFWHMMGPEIEHPKEFSQDKLERRPPRMVICHLDQGSQYKFQDIDNFTQQDLADANMFILDTFDLVYLWTGSTVNDAIRSQAYTIVKAYMQRDPAGRTFDTVRVWMTSQQDESETFTKYFRQWSTNGYCGQDKYDLARKRIRQENARIDVERQMVDRSHVNYPKHDYRLLLREEQPEDIDDQHKEFHLTDKQFFDVMRHRRVEFYRLPLWKQQQILKSTRLAYIPPATKPLSISTPNTQET